MTTLKWDLCNASRLAWNVDCVIIECSSSFHPGLNYSLSYHTSHPTNLHCKVPVNYVPITSHQVHRIPTIGLNIVIVSPRLRNEIIMARWKQTRKKKQAEKRALHNNWKSASWCTWPAKCLFLLLLFIRASSVSPRVQGSTSWQTSWRVEKTLSSVSESIFYGDEWSWW